MFQKKLLLILAIIALIIGLVLPIFFLFGAIFLIWYFVSIWGWRKFFKRFGQLIGILIILTVIILAFFAYKTYKGNQPGIDQRWDQKIKESPE